MATVSPDDGSERCARPSSKEVGVSKYAKRVLRIQSCYLAIGIAHYVGLTQGKVRSESA